MKSLLRKTEKTKEKQGVDSDLHHTIMRPALNDKGSAETIRRKWLTSKANSLECAARFERNEATFFNNLFRQFVWVLTEIEWRHKIIK